MLGILRSATSEDISEIRNLWKNCFDDGDDYLDLFFAQRFSPKHTALYCREGKILGMVHLLPCAIGGEGKAFYWYAACIHPDHRGKGYFAAMCRKILQELQKKEFISICKPANGLAGVYQKLGFEYAYYARDIEFSYDRRKELDSDMQISRATAEDFLNRPVSPGSLAWKRSDIEYAIRENEFCGGKALKFTVDGKNFSALAIVCNDGWILDSSNITPKIAETYQNEICNFLNANHFRIRIKGVSGEKGAFIAGQSDHPVIRKNSVVSFTMW